MASDWVDSGFAAVAKPGLMVVDAAGTPLDGVYQARETDDGVEAWFVAVDTDGREFVQNDAEGVQFTEAIAYTHIRGGALINLED